MSESINEQKSNNKTQINLCISEGMNGEGPNTILINPVLVFHTKYLPTALSLVVTAIIARYDFNINHHVEMRIVDDNNHDVIQKSSQDLNAPLPKGNLRLNWSLHNAVFEKSNQYKIIFTFDDITANQDFFIEADKLLVDPDPNNE